MTAEIQLSDPGDVPETPRDRPESFVGFWRRLAAALVDTLVLGGIGVGLGTFLFDQFASLGQAGRAVGFAIALLYFGLLNGTLGNGQTLGKRVMSIRVATLGGQELPISRSLLRAFILLTPFFLNGALLALPDGVRWIEVLAFVLIVGGIASIGYLFVFNRPYRRSLHDLAATSVVVPAKSQGPFPMSPLHNVHLFAVAGLTIGAGVLGIVVIPLLTRDLSMESLIAVRDRLESGSLSQVQVLMGTSWNRDRSSSFVSVSAAVYPKPANFEQEARRVASEVLAILPEAAKSDAVAVSLRYGYDIGIASSWVRAEHRWPPSELAADRPAAS